MAPETLTVSTVEYDANKNGVDSVTVFQTDRAEVRRRIKVDLKQGQNDVEVKNLPTCLQEDSIRVDGIGNATIFDVIYHPYPPYNQDRNAEALSDLNVRKDKIKAELSILTRQADVLREYSKTLKGSDTDSSKLVAFLDIYAGRQRAIDDESTKLYAELVDIGKEIEERRKSLDADEESLRKRGTRVTIVVLADEPGLAELTLTYVVTHAWWMPHYDVRAAIASDEKDRSAVALHYRASISQKTGEDWAGVQLTLSTASPLQGTDVPTLNPFWIGVQPVIAGVGKGVWFKRDRNAPFDGMPAGFAGLVPQHAVVTGRRSPSVSRSPSPSASPSYSRKRRTVVTEKAMEQACALPLDDFRRARVRPHSPEPPNLFRGLESHATEGAVSTTFAIPGLSTIPSDSDKEQQTHKVSIAELDFASVDLEWVSVPKDNPSAFLRCKVKNDSKYVLLPGQANIFLNGSFVAKSKIPHVSQQESFSCSLGIDPAIRITYHPHTKKTRTSGGNIIGTKSNVTSNERKITIKNTRLSRIPRLLVKDQVPVSRDARVKVNVLEPKDLASPYGGTQKGGKNGKEGVVARWSSWKSDVGGEERVDDNGVKLDVDAAQGMMEWVCDIAPGATVDLALAWEISAPVGVDWVKQSH